MASIYQLLNSIVLILLTVSEKTESQKPSPQACYYTNKNPYRNYGIFTEYWAAKRSIDSYAVDFHVNIHAPGCKTLGFWKFSREGTNLPGFGLVSPSTTQALVFLRDRIVATHQLGRGGLCREDISALGQWDGPPVEVLEAEGELTNFGAMDLYMIARRYTTRFFGTIFDYSPNNFRVIYPDKGSSLSSALALVYGMAPAGVHQSVAPVNYIKESRDLTQEFCKLSTEIMYGSNDDEKYILEKVTKDVALRLGLTDDLFGRDQLYWVYEACRTAMAVDPSAHSPWCGVFSRENLQTIEFVEDSIWYRRLGLDRTPQYDEMLSYQLIPACTTLRHLLEYFKSIVQEGHFQNHRFSTGRVIVGDATALLRLVAIFGINREASPVTVTNHWMLNGRKWRTSELAPYGGHLLLSISHCHQQYFVRAHLQEVPIPILSCPVDCPWEIFRDNMEHVLSYCPDVLFCAGTDSINVDIILLAMIITVHLMMKLI